MPAAQFTTSNAFAGKQIGPYHLEEEVGRSELAIVYRARRSDGEFDQIVAVKLIGNSDDREVTLERFRNERRLTAELNHPNIAYFYGGGSTEDGLPYFVMEFINGSPLEDHCREHKLNLGERLQVFRQICFAVDATHAAGIIHCDLTPNNFLVDENGKAKLLDFGKARYADQRGQALGGVARIEADETFTAPEALESGQFSIRSDIYSLGRLLATLASSDSLAEIVQKASAVLPEDRYSSVRELLDDVEAFLAQPHLPPVPVRSRSGTTTLAILPFDVSDEDDRYFGFGLADAIVTRLTALRGLVVRPISSAIAVGDADALSAGERLGVDFVVTGFIGKGEEGTLAKVQLLKVAERTCVWSREFSGGEGDLFAVEDKLAETIARSLLPQISVEESRSLEKLGTTDRRAFDAYIRGRYFWTAFSADLLPRALDSFKEAIEIDPSFPLPYIGIADFYIWAAIFGQMPSSEANRLANEAAEKALSLDPERAEAVTALGCCALFSFRFDEARRLFLKAIDLNPNYGLAHEYYSNLLCSEGRFEEAVEEIKIAEELEPLSPRAILMTAWTLYQARRFEEAEYSARRALEMQPDLPQSLLHLGNILSETGKYEEAVKVLREAAETWRFAGMPRYMLAFARSKQGEPEAAQKLRSRLVELATDEGGKPYFAAMACVAAGNIDEAFEWFERAYEEQNEWMIWFGVEPKLDAIRKDGRYRSLVERIGLGTTPQTASEEQETGEQQRSVAVLPFLFRDGENETDPTLEYLRYGIADALTIRLSAVKRFLVRPTSSVAPFGQQQIDPFVAGKELGVDFVLQGDLKSTASGLRLGAKLYDVKGGSVRWAASFVETFSDVLELEDTVSEQVMDSLLPRLSGDDLNRFRSRPTKDPKAYDAYLQGRYFWSQFLPETFGKAIESFKRAVEIDPEFALAHAGIADYYSWAAIFGMLPAEEAMPLVRQGSLRALEIDPSLAEAHAALGLYYSTIRDWAEAEMNYRRSIELSPNYPLSHEWLAAVLVGTGRFDEGIREVLLAESLDPIAVRPKVLSTWTLYQTRTYDAALEKANELLRIDPRLMQSNAQAANVLCETGNYDEAVRHATRAIEIEPSGYIPPYVAAFAFARAGQKAKAVKLVSESEERAKTDAAPAYFLAMMAFAVGNADRGFELMNAAADEYSPWCVWLASEPKLDPFRDDPRYAALLNRCDLKVIGQASSH